MGMPACTITSQTAHGGMVTVGFPTVLIGFLPASRIGDLHVCPMTTGPVPHVGGPFVVGSGTVIVGGMPQSRVTDHRIGVSSYNLPVVMDGDIDLFIEELSTRDEAGKLSSSGLTDDDE